MLKEVVNTKERCPRCGRGKLVTDTESGEMFCINGKSMAHFIFLITILAGLAFVIARSGAII